MAKKQTNTNIQVSFGIQGMERQSFQHLMDEKIFSFQRNGNIETDSESLALTNEHSNLLCSRFKPGYMVLGVKYDTLKSRIWFFITEKKVNNDGKRKSEIGFIQINNNITDESDLELDCGCDMVSILSKPLENTVQIPHCTYTTLIQDCEEADYCLNFDPNYPIHDIELKQEACGYTMTFVSKNNPPRYIIVDKISYYETTGDIHCGDESEIVDVCIDCDKLLVFPKYFEPTIYPEFINYGGNLKRGTYEYYVAYCDKEGNELTSYVASTNPVQIFDSNNIQMDLTDQNKTTNYSVKLKVENLDKRFNFYKVAVIERSSENETTTVYIEGIHSIVDSNINHTSSGTITGKNISLNRLFIEKPVYKNFGGLVSSNGYLFAYDYEVEKEWNLQPIANLLGSFVKWQTVEAGEGLYEDGVNASLYKTFMRDEVYPLGIKFGTNYGYKTALFPLIGRAPRSIDIVTREPIFNNDIKSILNNTPLCSISDRKFNWQFYNTSRVLGSSFSESPRVGGKIIRKEVDSTCTDENAKVYENVDIDINIDTSDGFYNIERWLDEHSEEICQATPQSDYYNPQLCEMITDNVEETSCDIEQQFPYPICDNYEECFDKYCDVESDFYDFEKCKLVEENCNDGVCTNICSEMEFVESRLYVSAVENETITLTPKRYPGYPGTEPTYDHQYSKTQCITEVSNNPLRLGDIPMYNADGDEVTKFDVTIWGGVTSIKDTPRFLENYNCVNAATIPSYSQNITSEITGKIIITDRFCNKKSTSIVFRSKDDIQSYPVLPTDYVFEKKNLWSETPAPSVPGFEERILKSALWYEIEFENDEEFLFEITPINKTSKCVRDTAEGDGKVRYVIYDKCKTPTVLSYGTYDAKDGLFLVLKKSDFGKNKVYLSLDTKIITNIKEHAQSVEGGCIRLYHDSFYLTSSICGCFDIIKRPKEYYKANIKADLLTFAKEESYISGCKLSVPLHDDCGVVPHEYGMFGYWESTEEYPDNSDLYDSSVIKLNLDKLSGENDELLTIFSDNYSNGVDSKGDIIWKETGGKPNSNFTCRPIRHFKMPDNNVSPFMSTESLTDFSNSKIYPLGVTIDESTINVFLDAAVTSGLITQEQRDTITTYEIYRGNRAVHKSVIFKGIANDMYEDPYQDTSGQRTFFRNFPYNTLGKNVFITEDKERKNLLRHPYNSTQNDRFSLIAPEVYYNRPNTPSEMTIEGYMYGKSSSTFADVKDHSEWTILGEKAFKLANTLALAEVALEAALNIATLTIESSKNFWFMIGITGGGNPIGTGVSIAAAAVYTGIQVVNLITVKLPKYKTQWLETFEARGSVNNFASMQVSTKGFYNYFKPNTEMGSKLRGLVTSRYLSNGIGVFTEVEGETASITMINNKDRENSVYLYTGMEYPVKYPKGYVAYDNADTYQRKASRYLTSNINCVENSNDVRNIASPYFSLKNYVPDQYGKVDEIEWLSLNHNTSIGKESKNIFGGDTFISRVDFKNKMRLFNKDAVGLADRAPFKYSRTSNVGYTRFYVDHKVANEQIGSNDMPYLSSEYNLDCRPKDRKFYEGDPSKFYLYSYGIPYFLVESEINTNLRYAGKEPHEQFASRGLNVVDWVQEVNTSIAYNNIFYYNNVYSRNQTGLSKRRLPATYDREKWDCLAEVENGVVWSEPDNSEVSLSDPWLVFKPFNIYRFPFSYGKLISLNAIESNQVMGRFANNMAIFNAVDVLRDRITADNEELGTGGIFATRPVEFNTTDLGETGSQNKSMVSNDFGHFWTDAKRGKVFQLQPNAKGLTAISDFKSKGEESGMRKWFKRHLPFKILKANVNNLTENDIDNHYKGLGILMWWDSRFKRVFITKKDYMVKSKYKNLMYFESGKFFEQGRSEEIELTNTEYFKDVSWTISYSPIYQSWISYYDFKPNYAVSLNDYFETGINYAKVGSESEYGIWSHLITNKSYQVFYGKYYPWEIEVPIKNTYTNNVLQDLKIWTISQRYHENFDYAVWRKKSFNKLVVYNQTNNSGILNLNYDDSINKAKYPIKISSTEQGIPATHHDEQLSINYFYNRVKKEDYHIPIWNSDENEILKTLNSDAVSFNSKKVLERLRGDWFIVRLIQDNTSQFKTYFKWMVSKEQGY